MPRTELSIDEIIAATQKVEQRIATSIPQDTVLCKLAEAVEEAARQADVHTRRMKGPLSLPKIRLYIVLLGLIYGGWWVYTDHFQVVTSRS